MKYPSSPWWLLAWAFLHVLPASASLHWQAAALSAPGVSATDLVATLESADPGVVEVGLQARSLAVAALGWKDVAVECRGHLTRPGTQQWRFRGELQLRGASGDALRAAQIDLRLDRAQNMLNLAITEAAREVHVAWPLDALGHMQIRLAQVPLAWIQGVLAQAWTDGRVDTGSVDANFSVDLDAGELRSAGQYSVRGAAFDTPEGTVAGAGLGSSGHWMLRLRESESDLALDAQLQGGELLLGPLYARIPAGARVRLDAGFAPGGVSLRQLHYDDGAALRLDGTLRLDAQGALRELRVDGLRALFPAAAERYGASLLASVGFGGLQLRGMVTASGAWDRSGWQRFSLDAQGLDISDPARRVGSAGLSGQLDWAAGAERAPTRLAWQGLTLLGLDLGAGQSRWRSHGGRLGLVEPAALPLLGGTVFLRQLDWAPRAPGGSSQLAAALAYTGIDLGALSRAFGWPAFSGTLAGAIPALDWDGERLRLDGGASAQVFGGFVDVTGLELRQPFSAAPVLLADVDFRALQLEPMTEVFGFGKITGPLRGHIHGLRMVSWRPVAFSAELLADAGGRISQEAVDSISSLGGGGIAGGLQAAVLNVFESFRYRRIGLSCRLRDAVCAMAGLGPAGDGGYTIVEGRGLPRIAVVGHQHQVDWATLVSRLHEATTGGGITIE